MTCTVEPFPQKLKLGKSLSTTLMFITGNHGKTMTTWINNKFKNGRYRTMKIGIAKDPNIRAHGYVSGDVMYPILKGNRSKCDEVENTLIRGLGMIHDSRVISNQRSGGAGPSWGKNSGFVYVVFSKREKVGDKKKGSGGKTTSTKAKSSAKKAKTTSTKAKTTSTKAKTSAKKAKSSAKKAKSSAKKSPRKGPIDSAKNHKIGTVKKGEDGKMWIVKKAGTYKRWQRK